MFMLNVTCFFKYLMNRCLCFTFYMHFMNGWMYINGWVKSCVTYIYKISYFMETKKCSLFGHTGPNMIQFVRPYRSEQNQFVRPYRFEQTTVVQLYRFEQIHLHHGPNNLMYTINNHDPKYLKITSFN